MKKGSRLLKREPFIFRLSSTRLRRCRQRSKPFALTLRLLRKELEHGRVELGGTLDLRDVTALVEDYELRRGEFLPVLLSFARERQQPVVLAPDNQRRLFDGREL